MKKRDKVERGIKGIWSVILILTILSGFCMGFEREGKGDEA